MLSRFSLLIKTLTLTVLIGAWGVFAHAVTVHELAEIYRDLPIDQRQYTEILDREMSELSKPYIQDIALNLSSDHVSMFFQVINSGADLSVMERYARLLENSSGTYLRFLENLHSALEKDPRRKVRIQNALEQILSAVEMRKIRAPYGIRITTATLAAINATGCAYALQSTVWAQGSYLSNGTVLSGLFAAYLATNLLGESMAFVKSVKSFARNYRERHQSKAVLLELQELVKSYSATPQATRFAEQYRYYLSSHARSDLVNHLSQTLQSLLRDQGRVRALGLPFQGARLKDWPAFLKIVSDLSKNLTETEKQLLTQKAQPGSFALPLKLQDKMLTYERKINVALSMWFEKYGTHAELQAYALRYESDRVQGEVDRVRPRKAVVVFNAVLSASMTAFGLSLALGDSPQALDAYLPSLLVDFIRNNNQWINLIAGKAVIVALAYPVYDWIRLYRSQHLQKQYLTVDSAIQARKLIMAADQTRDPKLQNLPNFDSELRGLVPDSAIQDATSFFDWLASEEFEVLHPRPLSCSSIFI